MKYKVLNFALDGVAGLAPDVTQNFFTQACYNFGITDIADGNSAKNAVFQLSVGFNFF